MQKLYFYCGFILVLFFSACNSTTGLLGDPNPDHQREIVQLKDDGALLVRLYVLSPKLRALRSMAENPELEADTRQKAQYEYDELRLERAYYVQSMIKTFSEHYDYSKLYFIPDSLFKSFQAGEHNAFFYNPESYKIDPEINFNVNHYIIYATGQPDYKYSLLNAALKEITRPKRYYGLFAGSFLANIFPFIKTEEEARIKSIQELNENFHQVWQENH